MSDDGTRHLISALASDLAPVRPLAPPAWRALTWLAAVLAIAGALAIRSDLAAVAAHIDARPEGWFAITGSAMTAALAAMAAFELSLPDRTRAWALLPLPAAAVWVAAGGLGCVHAWSAPAAPGAVLAPPGECLTFIIGLSLPLAALMFLMLRRGHSLQPHLTAVVAALACAAAAATLLGLIHPFDAAALDLAVHGLAVAIVVAAASMVGARVLA